MRRFGGIYIYIHILCRCIFSRKIQSRLVDAQRVASLSANLYAALRPERKDVRYLSAQTAFYSLNPDRDIPGPLAINPAYIRLAQASGQSYYSSGHRL
jgi:hypothetical protein